MEATFAALAPQLQPVRPGPLVPVLPALEDLLPERGLRPGAVVSVTGGGTALLMALAAAATSAGTWCAAVGFDGLGLLGAAEVGVDLRRLVVVEAPRERRPEVALALADGFGLLLLCGGPPPGPVAERLVTVARRSGCAVVVAGEWPGARLRARRLVVSAGGRGAAARERRVELWLPDADGAVRPVEAPVAGSGRSAAASACGSPVVV
ncbi:hypothetical protein ACWDRR_33300 [Kitasatospora sp. NPDC003701]